MLGQRTLSLALVVLLVALVVAPLGAQSATGKVVGTVRDPSGAIIANAQVTVTEIATGVNHQTTSDAQGFYQVLQLPIGSYRVTVKAPGFEESVVNAKTALEINQTLRVDVKLSVGAVSSEVQVSSQPPMVETENPTVGTTVTGNAIYELPLNGRNTLDLLETQAGTTPKNPDATDAAGSYSIGGMRSDSVTYLLNGGINNDLLNNGVVANPNPDAVAEFRVLESNYSAEYGRNAGGIVSVVSKSGTNQLHGTAYDYVRNSALDADSFFNNEQGLSVPVLKRNQFGGTIGGPIDIPHVVNGHNKLFFFFSYEGQRQVQDDNLGLVPAFTPLEAQGNFSQAFPAGQNPVANFLTAQLAAGNSYYQPNAASAAQGIIAPGSIDPVAKQYFADNLLPTSVNGLTYPVGAATDNYNEYFGKIDYNLSSQDTISATLEYNKEPTLLPFGGTDTVNVSGYPVTTTDTTYFGELSWAHSFTPTLLNEFRGTIQRLLNVEAVPAAQLPTPEALGTAITPDQPTGPPRIDFENSNISSGFDFRGPTTEADTTSALYDNLTYIHGNHTWMFGVYFSPYENNTDYDYFVDGEYDFYNNNPTGSGFDMADFLLGLPYDWFQSASALTNMRSDQYAGFAQDQWQIDRTFTLTLGLRYEYAQPLYDTAGRSFSYIPGLQSTRFPNAPPGLVFPGDAGAPTGANFPDKTNWAPRLGFAWDVFGNGRTSLRGGVGMFYDILKGEANLQFNGQVPFYSVAYDEPLATYDGSGPTQLQNPFLASGAVNPFPSKPPTAATNFAASGFLPIGGDGVFFVDPNLKTPYVWQYNLSLEQQLAPGMSLEIGYLGYSARDLTGLIDIDPFILGTNTRVDNVANPGDFSYMDEFANVGLANYDALEVNLRRSFNNMGAWGSSFFTLGYTWSHELDTESGFRERNDEVPAYDPGLFYANGDTDVPQALTISGGWTMPFDHLWSSGPKKLTQGWTFYPIFTIHSGFPLDVFAGLSTSPGDPGPSGEGDAGLVHADLVGNKVTAISPEVNQGLANPNNAGIVSTGNYYFNPGDFSVANVDALDTIANANAAQLPYYTYGTLPRNFFFGPGQTNLDLSLSKQIPVGERLNVELRCDAFNVLNHTEFESPDTTPTDATFGQVSTTYPSREIQLAVHLRF